MAEILVTVDRSAGRLVEQLVVGLRDGIRAGRIAGGTVLPPSRQLAAELRVSRGLVVEAYQQLVAEGYLPDKQYNALYGHKQLYFVDPAFRRPYQTTLQAAPTVHPAASAAASLEAR